MAKVQTEKTTEQKLAYLMAQMGLAELAKAQALAQLKTAAGSQNDTMWRRVASESDRVIRDLEREAASLVPSGTFAYKPLFKVIALGGK